MTFLLLNCFVICWAFFVHGIFFFSFPFGFFDSQLDSVASFVWKMCGDFWLWWCFLDLFYFFLCKISPKSNAHIKIFGPRFQIEMLSMPPSKCLFDWIIGWFSLHYSTAQIKSIYNFSVLVSSHSIYISIPPTQATQDLWNASLWYRLNTILFPSQFFPIQNLSIVQL